MCYLQHGVIENICEARLYVQLQCREDLCAVRADVLVNILTQHLQRTRVKHISVLILGARSLQPCLLLTQTDRDFYDRTKSLVHVLDNIRNDERVGLPALRQYCQLSVDILHEARERHKALGSELGPQLPSSRSRVKRVSKRGPGSKGRRGQGGGELEVKKEVRHLRYRP